MMQRLDQIQRQLHDENAEAVLLTHLPDVRWACGFTGTNGMLIVRRGTGGEDVRADFVTDGRYDAQADDEVEGASVHVYRGRMWEFVEEEGLLDGLDEIAFQADHVTVHRLSSLHDRFDGVTWTPVNSFLTRCVAQKDEREIEHIRTAQQITEAVFEDILKHVEPGKTEQEVAAEIVYSHLQRGAEKMSFDPIVASGPNAAKPHARPTDRRIEKGDVVVIDMGCFADGYASDMTRTVAVGEPSDAAREGYEVVLEAQEAALDVARAGLRASELDAAARDVIDDAGLGDYFNHSLGHGLGLQIHEWPRLSHTSDDELPPGTCVTIEPGVYVPREGYGVRIEDVVVLRDGGCENLTSAEKGLLVL